MVPESCGIAATARKLALEPADDLAAKRADRRKRVYEMVSMIPVGSVATYGQVADLADLGAGARFVGWALRHSGADMDIPWHRVINARGTVSFPVGSEPYKQQRRLLEAEGVAFLHGRVNLRQFRWQPSLDELLWGPMA